MTLTEEVELITKIADISPDPIAIYWRDHARQEWRNHRDSCATCKPWAEDWRAEDSREPPKCETGHALLDKWCSFYKWKLDYSLGIRGFTF